MSPDTCGTGALRPTSTEVLGLRKRWSGLPNSSFQNTGREYNPPMAEQSEAVRTSGMVPIELKHEPRSKGLSTPRKKKPKELAVITECCTGCAGSPACVEYCPVEDCMFWVPDEDN